VNFREQLQREKEVMNPLRYSINYRVTPLYAAITLILLLVSGILMSIDENKYLPFFIAMMVIFIVMTIALLASVPFIRSLEIEAEIKRHNFDLTGVCLPGRRLDVEIDEATNLVLLPYGVQINGQDFAYYDFTIRLNTANSYNRVWLNIDFSIKEGREYVASGEEKLIGFSLVLTRELLLAIGEFSIPLQNQADLDYVVNHQHEAFLQIYKFGHIKP